jgi:hypothetical protein
MPDDPALGEFRDVFKGLPGTFSEYPTAATAEHSGYEGATEIIDHLALFAKIAESPDDQAAIREYLRARLFDVFISDFDRHRKQWRWMRKPGDSLWHPIPEDRDQAFARYDGFIVRLVAGVVPQVRDFGSHYDHIFGLTYNGREQDRWLLVGLPREAWHAEAEALQKALTDEVLERAAQRMPAEWYKIDGPRLVAALKERRAALVKESDVFYEHLAHQVDVQADQRPRARAREAAGRRRRRDPGRAARRERRAGRALLRQGLQEGRDGRHPRLHARGGRQDRGRGTVGRDQGPRDRRQGQRPARRLEDRRHEVLRLARRQQGRRRIRHGVGQAPLHAPPGPETAPWIPPRDWGRDHFWVPWLSYGTDEGVFLGAGITTVGYGFRKHPWADQQTLRAGWAFGAQQPKIDYRGEFHKSDSGVRFGIRAYYSGLEILRYFGFGNETKNVEDDEFYKLSQRQTVFAPSVTFPLVGSLDLTVAPLLQYAQTQVQANLVTLENPYGNGDFGQIGGSARLRLDTKRGMNRTAGGKAAMPSIFGAAGYPVSGVYVEATGTVFPKAWDVEKTYGWVEGEAAGFLTAGDRGRATLAVRAGSKHMFGDYPFFNAAVVGGGGFFSGLDAVRGLHPNRFIGDTSLYGNAELRIYLSRFFVALPGEWGLFGFGDVGRVWLEGETSDTWHPSWGGGIWIGLLSRANSVAFTVAKSDERTAFYIRAGFSF